MDQRDDLNRAAATTFSTLSGELKLEIFDFVRSKYDQGNARLVCRAWNLLVKPRMWRNITAALRSPFVDDVAKLSEEQDSCFHDIRSLNVGGKRAIPNYRTSDEGRVHQRPVGPDYDDRFFDLIQVLREDHLLEFSSPKDTPLTSTLFLSLLRHQSNLRTFRARLDLSDIAVEDRISWSTEHTPLFTPALRSLRTLRIYAGERSVDGEYGIRPSPHGEFEMSCNGVLLKSAPSLDCLEVCGWPHYYGCWKGDRRDIWGSMEHRVPLMAVFANPADPICLPRSVTCLILADLDLFDGADVLINAINVAALRTLKLLYCKKPWPFLASLAASIRQTGTQIKVLTIRKAQHCETSGMEECRRGAMTDLLSSFSGLEELELDIFWSHLVDWESCLATQQTLRKLLVTSNRVFKKRPWPETISSMLKQCPDLQCFAYSPERFPSGDTTEFELPSSLPSTLRESLDAVAATAPSLRTLRLLYAPGLDVGDRYQSLNIRENPEWAEKAGQCAHRYASLILAHLRSKGSNIKVLALSPNSRWEQHRGDSNLCYYPHYFYQPRTFKHEGSEVVEAVPIRDYFAEYPDDAFFV